MNSNSKDLVSNIFKLALYEIFELTDKPFDIRLYTGNTGFIKFAQRGIYIYIYDLNTSMNYIIEISLK